MTSTRELRSISDDELLRRLSRLLRQSRRVEADLIAHIGEVDERRLYVREASPSMFAYCTEVLQLSEPEAYLRIGAARASRRFPLLLTMLGDGRLHLSGIAKLAPYLTETNCERLLARAAGKSKRQIEELIAEISPKPDVPAVVRKLPARVEKTAPLELRPDAVDPQTASGTVPPPQPVALTPRAVVEPLAPERYKIQFTASAAFRDKLERLKALMRSSVPDGDLAAILEEAVTEKLERLESKRFAKTRTPRKKLDETDTSPSSRHILAAVKRAVRSRDRDQCTFVDEKGRRCPERRVLEFHHHQPFGRGGDHSPENVRLMCQAHNAYQAERDYGKEAMKKYRRHRSRVSEPAPVYTIAKRTRVLLWFNVPRARKRLSEA